MAIGKTAASLILAGAAWLSAAQFPVRHEHIRKGCNGVMTIDGSGISFAGPKKHAWTWKFEDIQQLKLGPKAIHILTYEDNKLLLGADREYDFSGVIPATELYALLRPKLDQRFVPELSAPAGDALYTVPVKHVGRIAGSEGTLAFGTAGVVYSTQAGNDSRTWRYQDIRNLSTSGPFELSITTLEKTFNFQLKQALPEETYNQLWRRWMSL